MIFYSQKSAAKKTVLITIPLVVVLFIVWLYGTYEPSENTYSFDGQYSYYKAKYNYNKILQYHPFFSFDEPGWEYKAFLYDEVEHKMLASGSIGQIDWASNKWYGFDYDYNLFGFRAGHSVVLPRPFDKLSLRLHEARQQERKEEEEELERYESAPFLADTERIEPVLKEWTYYYHLDLSQARDMSGEILFCFSCPDPQSDNPYYRAFTPQDDSADCIGMFYSPDRKRYVDVGIHYKTENGINVRDRDAYDTTQQVYLIDRTLKQTKLLSNLGSVGMIEAAFWIDDDTFVLVGYIYDNSYDYYTVSVYDIANESVRHCRLLMDKPIKISYHNAVVLKEMGIEGPGEDTSGGDGKYSAEIGDLEDEHGRFYRDKWSRWERKRAEARQLFREWQAESPITAEDVAWLEPVIRPWLDFYGIDLSQARLNEKTTGKCFNCPPDTTSIHYDPFTDDLDTGERIDVDYSPDRQRYVDLGLFGGYYEQDGEYVFVGWDDMHEIQLVDRRQRHQNMILWFGVEGFAEAAFWKSDDVFVVVGYDYDFKRFVRVFDIAGRTETYYTIFADTEFGYDRLAYLHNVYWPQKGIIIHEEKE